MYHGYSYVYYGNTVPSLKEKGGIDRTDLIMKFLLQKRHLAPTHGSAQYIPEAGSDQMIIERVPDVFVSGHVHKASILDYRGITLVCSSCWQSITSFEEKLGLHPEPARLPVLNLQTRKSMLIKFGKE
jgi:DNA polymerase II small subunit